MRERPSGAIAEDDADADPKTNMLLLRTMMVPVKSQNHAAR